MLRAPVACPDCGQPSARGERYCEKHLSNNSKMAARRAQDKQRYEHTPYRAWYGWAIWRNLKAQYFNLNPMNAVCAYIDARTGQRCTMPAEEVDHIIPHRGNWDLFTDLKNFQGLCHTHHSQKTAREETPKR
jgi:5-methylcytosine-specific restriction enzyme A